MDDVKLATNRRHFLGALSAAGLGSTLLPGALVAVAQDADVVTVEMLEAAQRLAGLQFTPDELQRLAERLNGAGDRRRDYETLRAANLGNSQQPAIVFNSVPPGMTLPAERGPQPARAGHRRHAGQRRGPGLPARHPSRTARRDAAGQAVGADRALPGAAEAARSGAALRGQLHRGPRPAPGPAGRRGDRGGDLPGAAARDSLGRQGPPRGAGDPNHLGRLALSGADHRHRRDRLSQAHRGRAVLVAKLSMGALASGDRWFGGRTRSPWNLEQGSSGSSAGPGAATAAGLVGFSIGTETRGSIISPSTRNGVTGLRPTFGRVSRHGAMALSWTMDKIGPMCRSAEDCALVFAAIQGPDGLDNTLLDVPFNWDAASDRAGRRQTLGNNRAALDAIRGLGVQVAPLDLPDLPSGAIGFILGTEAAAAFDVPTLNARLDGMRDEPERSRWPDSFRVSRFVPAIEYLQANRLRMRIIEDLHEALGDFDLFVGSNLGLTNLTGHPEISMPSGFHEGSPTSLRFTGKLFGEREILRLAHAFQMATDHHLQHPPL
ncbi:Glutamyl-tRNA(Gln) amidotransferase subunit A [Geodia barretti]|uniref:Glutamyl-tRNA(Gln) amidotransferase subunit A n=1 Tax=Geodia barretti TaxID=519541 RepID=A0AA35STP7_GEOBA|nr:Glutamyl-tRNA(Gln) amidotransferase subunit A [Geodia barretti]